MKTTTVFVIINEQHTLLPDQESLLKKEFPEAKIEKILVPAEGWNLKEIQKKSEEIYLLSQKNKGVIVMASPVPAMIKYLAERWYLQLLLNEKNHTGLTWNPELLIFHNDHREKKELPDGRVIMTIAKEGWQLV